MGNSWMQEGSIYYEAHLSVPATNRGERTSIVLFNKKMSFPSGDLDHGVIDCVETKAIITIILGAKDK
jgi:hypothetical protein